MRSWESTTHVGCTIWSTRTGFQNNDDASSSQYRWSGGGGACLTNDYGEIMYFMARTVLSKNLLLRFYLYIDVTCLLVPHGVPTHTLIHNNQLTRATYMIYVLESQGGIYTTAVFVYSLHLSPHLHRSVMCCLIFQSTISKVVYSAKMCVFQNIDKIVIRYII